MAGIGTLLTGRKESSEDSAFLATDLEIRKEAKRIVIAEGWRVKGHQEKRRERNFS